MAWSSDETQGWVILSVLCIHIHVLSTSRYTYFLSCSRTDSHCGKLICADNVRRCKDSLGMHGEALIIVWSIELKEREAEGCGNYGWFVFYMCPQESGERRLSELGASKERWTSESRITRTTQLWRAPWNVRAASVQRPCVRAHPCKSVQHPCTFGQVRAASVHKYSSPCNVRGTSVQCPCRFRVLYSV